MKRILVFLGLVLFTGVMVAQIERSPVIPAVRARSTTEAERPDTANARRVLDELKSQGFSLERGTALLAPEDWVGSCFAHALPYQGAFDASSVWWGGTFNQPSSTTCLSSTGWWVDIWDVSVRSGDVFDIVFGGGYNTYVGIDDPASASAFYDGKYATTWSSSGSDYITGWIGFTVPAAWTNLRVYVERQTGQTGYLLGAVKRSSGVTSCTPSSVNLCLASSRFRVSATYSSSSNAGTATAVGLTGDTGYFWFFDSANVEAVVKVVDGRGVNGKFWVFAGGLTNVAVTITVRDTVTGATRNYTNPQNVAFLPVQDTLAFVP